MILGKIIDKIINDLYFLKNNESHNTTLLILYLILSSIIFDIQLKL